MAAANRRYPTMPVGIEVAAFETYEAATAGVSRLADVDFPLPAVSIVGSGVHLAEQITGRLTPGRVALAGATQGLTWGLLLGLTMALLGGQDSPVFPVAAIIAMVALGMVFSLVSWASSKPRRQFTLRSQVVATRYAVLVAQQPDWAYNVLQDADGNLLRSRAARPVRSAAPVPTNPAAAVPASGPDRRETGGPLETSRSTERGSRSDERPKFGVRSADYQPPATGDSGAEPPEIRQPETRRPAADQSAADQSAEPTEDRADRDPSGPGSE